MPITSITIANFKGIGAEVTVPLRPITLLFGKNSAGKSSVLHAMLYALEVLRTGKSDIARASLGGTSVDLGGFEALVHGHDTSKTIKIAFDIDLGEVKPEEVYPIDEFLHELDSSQIDLSDMGCDMSQARIELTVSTHGLSACKVDIDGTNVGYVSRTAAGVEVRFNLLHELLRWPVESTLGCYGSFGPVDSFIPGLHNGLQSLYLLGSPLAKWVDKDGKLWDEDIVPPMMKRIRDYSDFCMPSARIIDSTELGTPSKLGRRFAILVAQSIESGELEVAGKRFVHAPQTLTEYDELPPWEAQFIEDWETKSWYDQPVDAVDLQIPLPPLHGRFKLRSPLANNDEDDPGAPAKRRFAERLVTRIMGAPLQALLQELERIRYIGPIRAIPARNLAVPLAYSPSDWADGMAGWHTLLRAEPPECADEDGLVAAIDRLLEDHLDLGYELVRMDMLEVDPLHYRMLQLIPEQFQDYDEDDLQELANKIGSSRVLPRLALRDKQSNTQVELCDVGVGVSQVIPVVVGAIAPHEAGGRRGIFAVEQPELHLHPAAQCGLGDVFIKAMGETTAPMIIETHSEHLLLRLLRRISETTDGALDNPDLALQPDQLGVMFVGSDEDGRTGLTSLPIDEDGEFTRRWPGGFFEERATELFGR